jgi:hypothetical protein
MGAGETAGEDISGFRVDDDGNLHVPFTSKRFQWLPADVVVAGDGSVKFLSYINNAHPERHAALYPATASLLQRTLPLFERVLSAAATRVRRAIAAPSDMSEPMDEEDPGFDDSSDGYGEERQVQEPTLPESFSPPAPSPPVHLHGRIIQVCVCTLMPHGAQGSRFETHRDHVVILWVGSDLQLFMEGDEDGPRMSHIACLSQSSRSCGGCSPSSICSGKMIRDIVS